MDFKQIYVCKGCRSFYSVNPEKSLKGCPECGGEFVYVPFSYNKYSAMTDQEKEQFKADFLANNDLDQIGSGSIPQPAAREYHEYHNHSFVSKASGWVNGMKFANKLVFAIFIISAIVAFVLLLPNPLVALLASVLIFCIGFLFVGMSMVFLDMAADIKAVRDHLEHQ